MFDLINDIKAILSHAPAQRTASANGAAIDSAGYSALGWIINTGVAAALDGSNYFALSVESSADGSTGWTAISSDDYIVSKRDDGSAWDRALDAAGDASKTFAIGVRVKDVRYFRLVLTETGAADAFIGASAVLGHSRNKPN